MTTTIPANTYQQLAASLDAGEDLRHVAHHLLRPSTLADTAWFPPTPVTTRVSRTYMHRLITAALAAGAPTPLRTCFYDRPPTRMLELVLDDDDRAAVTLYALMFSIGLPSMSDCVVLPDGRPGRYFTATHLLASAVFDDEIPVAAAFGGWSVTVTCFVADRPAAPRVEGVVS